MYESLKVIRIDLFSKTCILFLLIIPFTAFYLNYSQNESVNLDFHGSHASRATNAGKKAVSKSDSGYLCKNASDLSESTPHYFIPDIYEPNNNFQDAKEIIVNTTQIHSIDPVGDVDVCWFELESDVLITIETGGSTDSDTVIYLYDSNFTQIATDDDSGEGYFSIMQNFLLPGKFYIQIEEYDNDSEIESYSLTLSAITLINYEPNDSFAEATEIRLNSSLTEQIYPVGDVDFLIFQLGKDGVVSIETSGFSGDTVLSLYDSNFTLLTTDDDGGSSRFSFIDRYGLNTGVYYIKVEECGNNSVINAYTITTVSGPVIGDSYEPDNSFTQATSIDLNSQQLHSINPVLDQDFLRFELSNTSTVTIETTGPEDSDTVIYLYDSNYSLIVSDDDDGVDHYSSIQTTLLQPGIYYIMVENYYDYRLIDSYTIILSSQEVISGIDDGSNDSFTQAAGINLNTTVSGSISHTGDLNYFVFQVETDVLVTIKITGSGDDDTVLYLYSDQVLVTSDDDSGSGSYSMIENYSLGPGKYYIVIEEYGNDETIGFYALSLTNRPIFEPVPTDDPLMMFVIIFTGIIIISTIIFFLAYKFKSRIVEMSLGTRNRYASRAHETKLVESDRYARRSGRRYIRRFEKPQTAIVDQPVKTVCGKPSDTCWSCGSSLPVDSLICLDCGFKRVKCLICKRNISFGREIGVCPVCLNKFHFGHLAETVKIFGKCPICRNSVKRAEIQLEKIVE